MKTMRELISETPMVGSTAHVVVAEDDAEMRELLVEALEADGLRVTALENGLLLLELLSDPVASEDIDLVVSDVRMPGRSGLEVLAALRATPNRVPCLLITGFGGDDVLDKAQSLGAIGVLDKPFELHDLRLAVRLLLEDVERPRLAAGARGR